MFENIWLKVASLKYLFAILMTTYCTCAKIQSRHISSKCYVRVQIQYNPVNVVNWNCRCKVGSRDVGTCSMSQLLYGILESSFLSTRFFIKTVTAVSIHQMLKTFQCQRNLMTVKMNSLYCVRRSDYQKFISSHADLCIFIVFQCDSIVKVIINNSILNVVHFFMAHIIEKSFQFKRFLFISYRR